VLGERALPNKEVVEDNKMEKTYKNLLASIENMTCEELGMLQQLIEQELEKRQVSEDEAYDDTLDAAIVEAKAVLAGVSK